MMYIFLVNSTALSRYFINEVWMSHSISINLFDWTFLPEHCDVVLFSSQFVKRHSDVRVLDQLTTSTSYTIVVRLKPKVKISNKNRKDLSGFPCFWQMIVQKYQNIFGGCNDCCSCSSLPHQVVGLGALKGHFPTSQDRTISILTIIND